MNTLVYIAACILSAGLFVLLVVCAVGGSWIEIRTRNF